MDDRPGTQPNTRAEAGESTAGSMSTSTTDVSTAQPGNPDSIRAPRYPGCTILKDGDVNHHVPHEPAALHNAIVNEHYARILLPLF